MGSGDSAAGATVQTKGVMKSIARKGGSEASYVKLWERTETFFVAHYGEKIPLLRSFSDLCTEIIFLV